MKDKSKSYIDHLSHMQVKITGFFSDCRISEIRGLGSKQSYNKYFYSPYETLKHSISFIA